MRRERALKVVLVLVGLLFSAIVYPLTMSLWQANQAEYEPMMLSLYVALGFSCCWQRVTHPLRRIEG